MERGFCLTTSVGRPGWGWPDSPVGQTPMMQTPLGQTPRCRPPNQTPLVGQTPLDATPAVGRPGEWTDPPPGCRSLQLGRPPAMQTPPHPQLGRPSPVGQTPPPPPEYVNKRAVRILLECILVIHIVNQIDSLETPVP